MNTYYSVIFASVNSIISERLSIGIVMVGDNRVWFQYSGKKLSLMRQFFTDEAFQLLKTSLKNIESTANSFPNKEEIANELKLFDFSGKNHHAFSLEYMRYLSRYCNSTLNFNEPVKIDIEASDELFGHLYNEFVFVETEETKRISTVETVKTNLYPSIKNHVNLDQRIETGTISGLIIPIELDFIGKNENPVVGKITDFNQLNFYLDASLGNLFVLMKVLEGNGQSGNYFIIGNEPDKQHTNQHKTWQEVRSSKFLDFVPCNETQRVIEYMKTHDVKPYFEVEND
ncbi:MAG: hypothetical protein NTY07_16755 [Bacteroidia bacterium]|nr:hypothetical protein [Bacteroidia bacterium]